MPTAEDKQPRDRRSWFRGDAGSEPAPLGPAIKLRRVELGISRRELADAAGLSYPYVAEIENGAKPGSANARQAIAEALGMRQHELLAWSEALAARPRTPAAGPPVPATPPPPRPSAPPPPLPPAPAASRSPAPLEPAYDDAFATPPVAPPEAAGAGGTGPADTVESLTARLTDVLVDADPDDAERALLLVLGEERVRAIVRDELRRARS
jgi:transcriptional regulator with XRE-family HTH domain